MLTEVDAAAVRRGFRRKCEPLAHWVYAGTEFYGTHAHDVIVLIKKVAAYDMIYASANPAHYAALDTVLSRLGSCVFRATDL
jgi:hypothetical protein